MPNILEKNNSKSTIQARREDILYREDIKTSFAYAIVGICVVAGLASIGYLGIKQLQK